jgi:hypothetical protein
MGGHSTYRHAFGIGLRIAMHNFDLTAHYSLLQAFDLTGRRIFGADWTGSEAWSRRSDDPAVSMNERAAIGQEIAALERSMADLGVQITHPNDADHKKVSQDSYRELNKKLREAESKYRHFLPSYDGWIIDHAAYLRMSKVDGLLMTAFGLGELKIYYGNGNTVPWEDWRLRPAFKVYVHLSMVRVPRSERSGRGIVQSNRDSSITPDNPYQKPSRYAAFVDSAEFNQWVSKYSSSPDAPGAIEPEEQCRFMIKDMLLQSDKTVLIKANCWQECKNKIPKLSERAFIRVWTDLAPLNWQKGGRRPSR